MQPEDPMCPICKRNQGTSVEVVPGRDAFEYSCELYGQYRISRLTILNVKHGDPTLLKHLSAYTRQKWVLDETVVTVPESWEEVAVISRDTTMHQRAEKLLKVIARRSNQPGDEVPIYPDLDYPLVDVRDGSGLSYFLAYWRDSGASN